MLVKKIIIDHNLKLFFFLGARKLNRQILYYAHYTHNCIEDIFCDKSIFHQILFKTQMTHFFTDRQNLVEGTIELVKTLVWDSKVRIIWSYAAAGEGTLCHRGPFRTDNSRDQ